MGETAISWCDHTFNLWWGCEHAVMHPGSALTAPECDNCYAEAFDRRLGGNRWGHGSPRRFFNDAYWAKLEKWNNDALWAAERRSVFVSSMSDIGEIHPDPDIDAQMEAARQRFWPMVKKLDCLDFLLLTKRPESLATMLPWRYDGQIPSNAWLGTTCGARTSLWRIYELRRTPAAHRFVSAEPLLDHITTDEWINALRGEFGCPECGPRVRSDEDGCCASCGTDCTIDYGIDWLIVGHESAAKSKIRTVDLDAVRSARDAAAACGVKFHFKQWHDGRKVVHLPVLDGRQWTATPSRDGT